MTIKQFMGKIDDMNHLPAGRSSFLQLRVYPYNLFAIKMTKYGTWLVKFH